MCQTVRLPDGTVAIVCGGHARTRQRCALCGKRSTLQCDYPLGDGRRCDRYLCRGCAVPVGRDRDYCRDHPQDQMMLLPSPTKGRTSTDPLAAPK
jgi:hypothetical protein